jgi:hypothetical protein
MSDLNAFPIKSRAFPHIARLRAYIVDPVKDPKLRHRGDQGPGAAGRAPADQVNKARAPAHTISIVDLKFDMLVLVLTSGDVR